MALSGLQLMILLMFPEAEVSINHLFGNLYFQAPFVVLEYVDHQEALGALRFSVRTRNHQLLKITETPPFTV